MGRDKLLLELGSATLLERAAKPLLRTCDEVLVVGMTRAQLPAGTTPIPDIRPDRAGPLAGIEAGLSAARNRAVFVAAADMPFLTVEVVRGLASHLTGGARIVVPLHGGRPHPLCAAYDRGVVATVRKLLDEGERTVWRALDACEGVEYVEEGALRNLGDPDLFLMNLNSPEDVARAEGILGA
jgi:molybdopterin-guanine dinucleotide biosynthesis protein A